MAAAADLKFAMEEMIREFQKDHPEIIVKVYLWFLGKLLFPVVKPGSI